MLTPEQIEGIPKEDLKAIRETAESLHEAVPAILDSMLNGGDVKEQVQLRDEMKLKLGETIRWLDSQIEDLEAVKREMRGMLSRQVTDKARLDSRAIELFVKAKELRQESRPSSLN